MAFIKGLRELEEKLSKIGLTSAVLIPAGERAMLRVEAGAKQRCPVGLYPNDPDAHGGNLRNSIHTKTIKESNQTRIQTGTPVFYAPFVEYGTGQRGASAGYDVPDGWTYGPRAGMRGTPYLRPAWDDNKKTIVKDLERAVREELKKL
jgi:HK97 gp10 family phage protein